MTHCNTRRAALILVTGIILSAASIVLGQFRGGFVPWIWLTIATAVVPGLLMVLLGWGEPDGRWNTRSTVVILIGALFFRLAIMQTDRELSDDAARYHWDGKILAAGINPYLFPPDDPRLDIHRIHPMDGRINHPWVRTVYPPLAELIFAVGYVMTPGDLLGMKLLALVAEIITWLLLLRALDRNRRPRENLLISAWSPLIIVHGYLPGHVDTFALPLVVWFILETNRGRTVPAGIALGLASLIKPLPLIFLPAALRTVGKRPGTHLVLAMLTVIAAGYLPFVSAGVHLFSSMWLMATKWSFNGTIAAALEAVLPMTAAHAASATILLILVALGSIHGKNLVSRMLMAFAAFTACTSNLFPWYLIWMYPLLTLHPDPACLAFGALIPLSDEVVIRYRLHGVWSPGWWPRVVAFSVFYSLLGMSMWKRWGMFSRYDPLTPDS